MTDPAVADPNQAQIDYWNTLAGDVWTRHQAQLDRQLEPLGKAAMAALAAVPGDRILDVGCGCGVTSLALAAQVAPGGSVVGIDISEPMLEVAGHRPRPPGALAVAFRRADAQREDLGEAAFDAVFSRFGVMFFSDPTAAFANLRAALKPGGRLGFVCWRALAENPWMGAALAAVRPLLPPMPPPDPLAPGPFAFADRDRVRAILTAAGFGNVSIQPFDTRIGSGDLEETLTLNRNVGPLASVLRDHPELVAPVTEAVRAALRPHLIDGMVMMDAAVWIVTAVNPLASAGATA